MTPNSFKTLLCSAIAAALACASATAADVAKAREILNRSQASIIGVSSLCKLDFSGIGLPVSIGGMGDAQEANCNGVVIDTSGLTVVSYAALNPMENISSGIKIKVGDEDEAIKSKSELTRIRMNLPDGTEVPARLVFKDTESDLAFLLPEPKEGQKLPQFVPVNLAAAATASELDEVVFLSRQKKELGSEPIVSFGHITSVIKKPRLLYDLSASTPLASTVFMQDGRILGIVIAFKAGGDAGGLRLISAAGGADVFILPASEVSKLAEQAKKAAGKKPATDAKGGKE